MKQLQQFICENLSKENIEKLSVFVNDNNISEILDILNKHLSSKLSEETTEKYNIFFEKHGILNLNWGRKNGALKQFINLFNEENHVNVLNAIINNFNNEGGVVSINDLSLTGNIFDYCKIKVDGEQELIDWSDEAKTISTWINSKSASAGPAEMLLKFMIKEAMDAKEGDVGIKPDKIMEVKSTTFGSNNYNSGAHPIGQKGNIRKTFEIYRYLNKNILDVEETENYAKNCRYFQGEGRGDKQDPNINGLLDFNNKCLNKKLTRKKITEAIVDAICFQYNFIENIDNKENNLEHIKKLKEEAVNFSTYGVKNGWERKNLLNLVGCIQLYLYSQIEGFHYFLCVSIDKSDNDKNPNNGKYLLIKDCDKIDTKLLNFNYISNYLWFGALDSTVSSQGRTGKIYIK